MSKSKGNTVLPSEIIKKYSADILRMWAAEKSLGKDIPYKEEDLKEGRNFLTKLWNASRFVDGFLVDYSNDAEQSFSTMDKWMLQRLDDVINKCTDHFENLRYDLVKKEVTNFFHHDFCDNYLEIAKNRLYSDSDPKLKAGAKYVLKRTLEDSLKLLAPIVSHITEELYHKVFAKTEDESIHNSAWPTASKIEFSPELDNLGNLTIETISYLRTWKNQNNLRLCEPIEELNLTHPNAEELLKVVDILQDTLRIKKLNIVSGKTIILARNN